jgi:transglutaminase-like putative cysteine protease
MNVTVLHETAFEYSRPIQAAFTEARLRPVTDAFQTCHEFSMTVDPLRSMTVNHDYYGNSALFFNVLPPHRRMVLTARSIVETHRNPNARSQVSDFEARKAHLDFLSFDGPVEALPAVEELVDESGLRGAADSPDVAFKAAQSLNALIYERFTHAPGSTDVHTKISQVFDSRLGVCQDFAHIFIAVCRAAKLPARYVSGYLITRRSRSDEGSSASHAWAEVLLPERGWCAVDPTNHLLANDFYIKLAHGRDYRDVPPTRGIYRGGPVESRLRVRIHTTVHHEDVGTVLDSARELVG